MQKYQLANKTFDQISYYKTGNGPVIFLVHGFPANAGLWREVIPDLSAKYTLILPDFFGQENHWVKEYYSTSTQLLADAFYDILEHEQCDRVLMAGHSMGGYMGLEFARKYPQRLAGLSLIHSSSLADDPERAEGRKKTVSIIEQGGKSPFLKKMVRALFAGSFISEHPEVVQRQTEEALMVGSPALLAFYRAIMERRENKEILYNARFPVQQIIGWKDPLGNYKKDLAQDNLAEVNFVDILPMEAHMAMLENPALFLKVFERFANYCFN